MNVLDNNNGYIYIWCKTNSYPIPNFMVTLYNSDKKIIYREKTDKDGLAICHFSDADEYIISVKAPMCYGPAKAYRWVNLKPNNKYACYFNFDKIICCPDKVRVILTLSDLNYPNLKLEKGEFSLWQNLQPLPMPQA